MRIVGYIEHPKYKITIMHMNHRYALKFENDGIEQTYKIRASETITGAESIKVLITESVLSKIDAHFDAMETTRFEIISSTFPDLEEEFEEII